MTSRFSGDLETNEQQTVKYGYVENLALNVLPQYREGSIVMGYTVANGGGLPFSDTLHFELYAVGNAVAIYTADKTYNLYPGAEASADALELSLAPGAYQLRWTTGKGGAGQADFSVLPSGIGQLAFAPAAKYPVGLDRVCLYIDQQRHGGRQHSAADRDRPGGRRSGRLCGNPQLLYKRRRERQRRFQF